MSWAESRSEVSASSLSIDKLVGPMVRPAWGALRRPVSSSSPRSARMYNSTRKNGNLEDRGQADEFVPVVQKLVCPIQVAGLQEALDSDAGKTSSSASATVGAVMMPGLTHSTINVRNATGSGADAISAATLHIRPLGSACCLG